MATSSSSATHSDRKAGFSDQAIESLDASETLTIKQYGIRSLSDLTLSIADNNEVQFSVHKAIVAQNSTFLIHLIEGDRAATEIELVSDMPVTVEEIDLFLQTIYGQNDSYLRGGHTTPYFTVGQLVHYQGRDHKVALPYQPGEQVTLQQGPFSSPAVSTAHVFGGVQDAGHQAFATSQPQQQQQPQHVQSFSGVQISGPPLSSTTGGGPRQGSLFDPPASAMGCSFLAPTTERQQGQSIAPSSAFGGFGGHAPPLFSKRGYITVDEHQLVRETKIQHRSTAACELAERLLPVSTYFEAAQLLDEYYTVVQAHFNFMTTQQKLSWLTKLDESHNVTMLDALLLQVTPADLQDAAATNRWWYQAFRPETVGKLLQRAVSRP